MCQQAFFLSKMRQKKLRGKDNIDIFCFNFACLQNKNPLCFNQNGILVITDTQVSTKKKRKKSVLSASLGTKYNFNVVRSIHRVFFGKIKDCFIIVGRGGFCLNFNMTYFFFSPSPIKI